MTEAIPESATAPLSEGQRIVDTFVAPSKTFTDLLRNASFWGPLLILIVMSIVFSFAVQKKVGWDKTYDNILHQSPKGEERFAQMPPDQAANIKAVSAKFTAGAAYGTPVIVLIITAIYALLVWATINFGFGGTAKYGQVFAVYMYANLVLNVKYILATIALFAGMAPDSFLIQNPVGSNIGYYLGSDAPKWLMTLCTHMDIFEIWSLILCVIGIAIVARVKRGAAITTVVGWWLLIILVFTGLAVAQG